MADNCSFVVSSCDKYETAWYPYFELVKKYWQDRPEDIYLITESKTYTHEGLSIKCFNGGTSLTWSERLYQCLSQIQSKYIIFSLEDFFLLDNVKNDQIEKCFGWMEENPDIAVCRLAISDNRKLRQTKQYANFYIAGNDVGYRLDTQLALWNRETLISFLDMSESPWDLETFGTKRIMGTDKIFLWNYSEDYSDYSHMIYPYMVRQIYGYGIAWSRWLWMNKQWFEKNGIYNINYKKLGVLSERHVRRRIKYLYNPNPDKLRRMIKYIYQIIVYTERVAQNIRIYGVEAGMKISYQEYTEVFGNKYRRSIQKYRKRRHRD